MDQATPQAKPQERVGESELDRLSAALSDDVRARIQSIADCYDEDKVRAEEGALRERFRTFFEDSLQWAAVEAKKADPSKSQSPPRAAEVQKTARAALRDVQANLIDFAICYMHINRFMTLVRDEMRREEGRSPLIAATGTVKWTSDTGVMMGRHKKRKGEIAAFMARDGAVDPIFDVLGPAMESFRTALMAAADRDGAQRLDTALRSALRTANITRAKAVLSEAENLPTRFSIDRKGAENAVREATAAMRHALPLIEDNIEALRGPDGRLFLTRQEMMLLRTTMEDEVRRINAAIVKYNLPYMAYKLDTLAWLKDKLLVMGTLDGLIGLYRHLLHGIARPITNQNALREYEGNVVQRILYLNTGQFAEIEKIAAEARKTVDEFRTARATYTETIANFDPTTLQEGEEP